MEMVIFLGPPGAGKGTQAKILSRQGSFAHLSTGDLVRAERDSDSAIGQKMKAIGWSDMDALDAMVLTLLERRLAEESPSCVILDGCPRTLSQAEALDDILARQHVSVRAVAVFIADEAVLVPRLTSRFACRACGEMYHRTERPPQHATLCDICGESDFYTRPEDTPEYARQRLSQFTERMKPVFDYYAERYPVYHIEAGPSVPVVTDSLYRILLPDAHRAAPPAP